MQSGYPALVGFSLFGKSDSGCIAHFTPDRV